MKKEFSKISIEKNIHEELKLARDKLKLKSIGKTILYFMKKYKK